MSAYSDAFFGPVERFREIEAWRRWCDADYARESVNGLVGEIAGSPPDIADMLHRRLRRDLDALDETRELLMQYSDAQDVTRLS